MVKRWLNFFCIQEISSLKLLEPYKSFNLNLFELMAYLPLNLL